jgi:hypothetical protein
MSYHLKNKPKKLLNTFVKLVINGFSINKSSEKGDNDKIIGWRWECY